MYSNTTYKSILIFLMLLVIGLIIPELAEARAGGGSSGGNGGGGIAYIISGICTAVMGYIAYRKNKQCKELLAKISKQDEVWDHHAMRARIEKTFLKVQIAWKERNQDLARDYISERLYQKHKIQTDEMITNGHKPMMFEINLKKATIVEISDYEDDSKDRFCVLIEGSMIDYLIDEKSNEWINGSAKNESFKEFWRFVRVDNTWLLDEIDQDATIRELFGMTTMTEESL